MRAPSLGFRRRSVRLRTCLIGLPAQRPVACPRWLLWGALLLLGLCRALDVQAAEPPRPSGPDPRPATPPTGPVTAASTGSMAAAAPLALLGPLAAQPPAAVIAATGLSQARTADSFAAGSPVPAAAAVAVPPEAAFRGFGDELPVAAEPPPLVAPSCISATPCASPPSSAAVAAVHAAPSQPAAASPPPPQVLPKPPQPKPALGFDATARVPRRPYGKLIYQVARSYALNPLLVAAIAKVESDFNPRARSRKGACGLMQVLPATARRFGLQRRRDLFNPRKNVETASRYLRWLVDRFGDDPMRVLAAYNAGEGAVDRFGGVPPFAETRDYVTRIFSLLGFAALLDAPVAAVAPAAAAVPVTAAAALAAPAGR